MRDHYDFSNGIKNPYAELLKKQSEKEKTLFLNNLYKKLEEAEKDLSEGRCTSLDDSIAEIRKKHNLQIHSRK